MTVSRAIPRVISQKKFAADGSKNFKDLNTNCFSFSFQWFKNTMELTDENARLNNHGHRHTLMIPSVTEEDLGNYTCRAENKHGLTSRELEVSGKIGLVLFTLKEIFPE